MHFRIWSTWITHGNYIFYRDHKHKHFIFPDMFLRPWSRGDKEAVLQTANNAVLDEQTKTYL